MLDGQERSASERRQTEVGAVTCLASQALSVLATRRPSRDGRKEEALLAQIEAAVRDSDPHRRIELLADIRRRSIPDAWVAEVLIPKVARRLGAAWCEDSMSFAEVTIGSARLQAMVRDLGPTDAGDAHDGAPLLAVIVPAHEHHTLGALTLTGQLRRLGFCVKLFLGVEEAEVVGALADDRFDAVLVSMADGDRVAWLAGFVKKLRKAVAGATPIIVGGAAVTRGLATDKHFSADIVTSDIFEALRAVGLKAPRRDEIRHEEMAAVKAPTF